MDRILGAKQVALTASSGVRPSYPTGVCGNRGHTLASGALLTVVVHHSCLLLAAVHGEPDDLHLHKGVDDLGTG